MGSSSRARGSKVVEVQNTLPQHLTEDNSSSIRIISWRARESKVVMVQVAPQTY